MLAALAWAGPVLADSDQAMRTALELTSGRDYAGALAVAPAGVGVDIVEWQRLRAGQGSFAEYEGFLARHPDWPGLPLMYEKAEGALAETADPTTVIGWFSANPAVTGTGAVAHVKALLAADRNAEAETEAMRAWATLTFTPEEEAALDDQETF
ncbi:MAG: hypothetical protein B7Y02_02595 [Rhodobacterales bacterium 17-64-5]|nr:MAG: hypothetical protein B7Y02_02595 [Rhodobacterales bacterium 17-64-5]